MGLLTNFYVLITCVVFIAGEDKFWKQRDLLMAENADIALGSQVVLNEKEKVLNDVLMKVKKEEISYGMEHPEDFPATLHFFRGKEKMKNSKVYKILKKMPKGGSLYSHNGVVGSNDFYFELTRIGNLYCCFKDGTIRIHFFKDSPDDKCNWESVKVLREKNEDFDKFFRSKMSIRDDNPEEAYPTTLSVVKKMSDLKVVGYSMYEFRKVIEEYLYNALATLYDHNVKYVETRTSLLHVYDFDKNDYDEFDVAQMYADVLARFKSDHPDMMGTIIYQPENVYDNATMNRAVETFFKLKEAYPDVIAGFELSCVADSGRPLSDFLPQIRHLKESNVRLLYHEGNPVESKYTGQNLLDAVLLNATRIGHSHILFRNPVLSEIVKKRNIGIEVSPIESQVYKLVQELRNHPGSMGIYHGWPLVITSSDGALWEAEGLTYDWYMAFMAMANDDADLRLLKQLAFNSLNHSALDEEIKELVVAQWLKSWNKFVNEFDLNEFL